MEKMQIWRKKIVLTSSASRAASIIALWAFSSDRLASLVISSTSLMTQTIDGIPMNIEFKLLLLFRRKNAHFSKFSPRECGHLGLELHLGSLDGLVGS